MNQVALDYYASPGRFTTLADADRVAGDVAAVVKMVQGLLVYDLVAQPFYDVKLSREQAEAIHERDSARLLEVVRSLDPRSVEEARPPDSRVGARCHAYSRMTVAFLRSAGVPARARCGFGTYFHPGFFEDHWVVEHWNSADRRWQMVDAQLDPVWLEKISFAGDPLALTSSEFVTAGHAWQAWRRGELDADTCGLSSIQEYGSFWIAGNLRLDVAALNKVEMLPWDVWGAGWEPGDEPTDDVLRLFDSVAELTVDPDAHFTELRDLYETTHDLRVPGTVFSVLRGRSEAVSR